MTDRDRLAADLATTGLYEIEADFATAADRLIALGWTRKDSKDLTVDEDRLARALLMAGYSWESPSDLRPDLIRRFAADIAKAYREDTDDR